MVQFQLLGHVVARSANGPIPLGSARQRAVLAALLVEPGVPVPLEQLVYRVWGATSPRSARQTLHSYISRLRSVLDDARGPTPARRSGGYALDVDPTAVDLHHFRALVARARCADDGRADALWQDAMTLWKGRPFADLDSDWLRSVAVTLEAERQAATLDHYDLLLRRGEHARLLPEVAATAQAHPLDERLAGQLMRALYGCGRQADALAHFRQVQERLAEELGSDPGAELRELHQLMLRHDPGLTAVASTPVPSDPDGSRTGRAADGSAAAGRPAPDRPQHRPAQLPLDVPGFTGRADDLRRLDDLLPPDVGNGQGSRAVTIAAIRGTAGVGKTALAVHWAHRAADRFPDGQLYVNLRGYDPDQPMRPAEALARFLVALGVAERDIPLDDDERAARYRSELAGRRMLIVLDNAGSVAQVRPLLPGSGATTVVVTSRDSLAGLVAVHGANQVDLDLLRMDEATDLLRRLIGEQATAEPAAVRTLAEQCARLPLALRVAAVLATSQPDRPLAEVVAELSDRQVRLELLDPGGDPYAAVHAVFSWSVQHLPEHAARTFRRLGLHPGPDLDPHVAAALTDTEPRAARRVLEALVSAHLLHRTGPDRYGMHDLLRAYAAHLTVTADTDEDREAAARRLLAYYQAAAVSAMDALHPAEALYRPDVPQHAVDRHRALISDLTRPVTARSWLESERFCVIAIAEHAADQQLSDFVGGLARILHRYLGDTHLTDLLTINSHALRAAERAGDRAGQAHALRQLSVGYTRVTEYDTSTDHLERALVLFREIGDTMGEALALSGRGIVRCRLGSYDDALDDHYAALALSRQDRDPLGEAIALIHLGIVEERTGNYVRAAQVEHQALAIVREVGARNCESVILNNLANAEMELERYSQALDHARQSLVIIEELGSPMNRAHTLDTLGTLHLRLGEPGPAGECFRQALTHYRQIGEQGELACSVNGLGEVAQATGDPTDALSFHTEALTISTDGGSRHQQARAHAGLGHAHRALGDLDHARTHYEFAYALYTKLGLPEAGDIVTLMGEVRAA